MQPFLIFGIFFVVVLIAVILFEVLSKKKTTPASNDTTFTDWQTKIFNPVMTNSDGSLVAGKVGTSVYLNNPGGAMIRNNGISLDFASGAGPTSGTIYAQKYGESYHMNLGVIAADGSHWYTSIPLQKA